MVTVQESLQQVDSRISVEQNRLEDLQQRLIDEKLDPEGTSSSRGALDDRIGDSRRLLKELGKAKINIQKGFTAESAISVAFGIVSAASKKRTLKRQRRIQETIQPTRAEIEAQQSLLPQFRGGDQTILPTAREIRLGQSLPLQFRDELVQPSQNIIQSFLGADDQLSVVGLPSTPREQALALGREERRPSPRFNLDLVRSATRQFFSEGGTPITAVGTLVSPLERFSPFGQKREDIFIPKDLKISDEFKIQTRIERQREQALIDPLLLIPAEVLAIRGQERISRELVSELQPLITRGELTITEAEKKFQEQFLTKFEEGVTPSIKRRQEFITEFEKGTKPRVDVVTIGELGAIGLGSLTPVGQALIATSFVAEGLPKITGGETLLERGIGVAEVGLGLGTGGLVTKGIERSADILLLQELQVQRGVLTGKEVARFTEGQLFIEAPEIGGVVGLQIPKGGGRGAIFEIKTIRGFGEEAKLVTELRAPTFETGLEKFSITGGKGKTTLEFFSFEKGKPITIIEQFKFGGRQAISPAPPRSIVGDFKFTLGEDVRGAFGRGFVQRRGREEFIEFGFGGISKDIQTELGKFSRIEAGKISGVRLEGVEPLFRGGRTFRGGFVKVPIEEAGAIRRLTLPTTGLDVRFISPAKIKKTPLSQTFQEIQIPSPVGISKGIEKQIFKAPIVKQEIVSRSLIGIPRSIGGEGLSKEELQRGVGFAQQELVQPLLFPPIARQDLGVGLVQPELIIQRGRQKDVFGIGALNKLIQKDISKTLTKTLQVPETKLEQRLNIKQLQKQFQVTEQIQIAPPAIIPRGRTPFEPFGRGDFGLPFIPPFFILPKERQPRGIRKKGKKARVRIAPSFTGIVLEIETGIPETTIIGGIDIGILPGQIRGIPKRKKGVKKKKVSKKKKK